MASERHNKDAQAPVLLLAELQAAFWQMPAMFYTSWWNAVMAPFLTGAAPRHHSGHSHEGHHHAPHDPQLDVPDPIEREGEHALFA